MTSQNAKEKAISEVADSMHEEWRNSHFAAKGEGTPRWKPMNDESVQWTKKNGTSPDALQINPETGKPEINIAGLRNSQLPPQHAGENTAAARGAVEAVLANPKAGMEAQAATVHEQWLQRNGSWAPPEQKKPYAQLSEPEKEKDRVVVRAAQEALAKNGLLGATAKQQPNPKGKTFG
jgi:hypothetical protein